MKPCETAPVHPDRFGKQKDSKGSALELAGMGNGGGSHGGEWDVA